MQGWLLDMAEAITVFNLIVSIAIAINAGYTVRQKIAQIVLVWLIPALGGIIFGVFLWTQRGVAPPERESSEMPDRAVALSEAVRSIEQHRG